ncbi:MAG: TA system VapC family ribonuclease toxin [Verrucomicrobiota bacterium]
MSYSIDANLLIYASDTFSPEQSAAFAFLTARAADPDLMCLTWSTVMAYQRIVTHPSIFSNPLDPLAAWKNIQSLLALPRTRIITEEPGFADDYLAVTDGIIARGNLVPDAHIATVLRQHGVRRIYTADTDFRKFSFLEVINPLR